MIFLPSLGTIYTDDSAHFGPRYVAIAQQQALAEDAVAMAGRDVINDSKTIIAVALPITGWLCSATPLAPSSSLALSI